MKHSLKYDVKVLKIKLDSPGYTVLDITPYIAELVNKNLLNKGIALVYTNEKNGIITEIEYEPELLSDLEVFLKNINCIDKGLCDIVLGRSVAVPVVNGDLFLGQFKNIVFIDLSRNSEEKTVVVVLEGIFKNS
uniref:YjbQ family protein n=1 Tax=Ignisphaera aggregans TaxID=334771 RepID=A0A832FXE2_9CREN